jgi:hypothetical protein
VGFYVDTDDIRQHMRGANALAEDTIDEIMTEQEYYVQTALRLTSLPPANPILSSIIRDLTVAASIYALTAPNNEDLEKADTLRREAYRRLDRVDDKIGLGTVGGFPETDPTTEVDTLDGSFFTLSDFDQFDELGREDYTGLTTYIIRP